MADITRESFDETKRYHKVIFQRGKDVLDAELNELQDNLRVHLYKNWWCTRGGKVGSALADGLKVTGDGTNNQVTITAGAYQFYGYSIELLTNTTLAGFTTPGAGRIDAVWVSVTETEITSVADPDIRVAALGETTRRRQLTVTFGFTEGSDTPPADDAEEPWEGGTKHALLGHVRRPAAQASISATDCIDRRHQHGLGFMAGQDRNIEVDAVSVSINSAGTEISFEDLRLSIPGAGFLYTQGATALDFTLADGEAIGFSGATGSLLRRRLPAAHNWSITTEDQNSALMEVFPVLSTVPNDDMLVLARRHGSDFILRGGIRLQAGDITRGWSQPNADLHQERILVLGAAVGQTTRTSAWDFSNVAGAGNKSRWLFPASENAVVTFAIPLFVGLRLNSVTVRCHDDTGNPLACSLVPVDLDGVKDTAVDSDSSVGDDTDQAILLSGPVTVTTAAYYEVNIRPTLTTGGASNHEVFSVVVRYENQG